MEGLFTEGEYYLPEDWEPETEEQGFFILEDDERFGLEELA